MSSRLSGRRGFVFAIAGGHAVALHGAVRGTLDVDLVLAFSRENFAAAESALNRMGLQSRLPLKAQEVFDFREEYIRNRNLIAWSFVNTADPTEIVDIILTEDLDALQVELVPAAGLRLPVVAVADLIRMKEKSGRPQDLVDIQALREYWLDETRAILLEGVPGTVQAV